LLGTNFFIHSAYVYAIIYVTYYAALQAGKYQEKEKKSSNMNMNNWKIAIIGLGLIGGSLARALRERCGISDIIAVNRSSASLEQALRDGSISRGFNEITDEVLEADIVFICTPVKNAVKYVKALAGKIKPSCVLTDVGSTKEEITNFVDSMESPPCFIGGHPMAGTEKTGYVCGFSHLFENAYYILTPCKSTTQAAMEKVLEIVKAIGAIPVVLDAAEHDRITGGISHVPHIIAAALVNLVKDMDSPDGKMRMLAAGGFKDITRIASSSPEMWENIVLSNRLQIKEILERYMDLLENFKRNMEDGNSDEIFKFFKSARNYRDSFSSHGKSLINPVYEITVDVVDKPGVIGRIATILGDSMINIKNINVSNNREMENGCLKITLQDEKSANIAIDLLTKSGYKIYRNN